MVKVCHMTDAHDVEDVRIFHKECVSLARAGYEVYLVERGDCYEKDGVHIVGVGEIPASRRRRMTEGAKKVYEAALALDADIYHLHDPELLPYGLKLKQAGKRVIFDSHEDYASTITEKTYLPALLRGVIARLYVGYEKFVCSQLDGVVACYHWTRDRLAKCCPVIDLIFNYPIIHSAGSVEPDYAARTVCYVGGIVGQYNLPTALRAISKTEGVRLLLAGSENNGAFAQLRSMPEWERVDYLGKVDHRALPQTVYQKSSFGVVLLDYIAQCHGHIGNLSNIKLFEVLEQGLPVVCTDFDLWKQVVEENHCGICVDPHNEAAVTAAIRTLAEDPALTREMGQNARRAIEQTYNWGIEEKKLLTLYHKILSTTVRSD